MSDTQSPADIPKLEGLTFVLAAVFIALSNFLAVMNMTVANVALPTIAGDLGISTSQGNWVITFYAVAEAITVPLTGWLSARYGSARVFSISFLVFGVASALCGLSSTLPMLVCARMLQGFSGGLLMPLSQILLLRIFPDSKATLATAVWSMTTLVAPVVGPILGGYLCDNYSWGWAFLIDLPFALVGSLVIASILWHSLPATGAKGIDKVGLLLLVFWVSSLQVMLDEGKDKDWFASTEICLLLIAAVVGFVAFMIWELTEEHPVIDLRVFKHRGYAAAVLTLMITFGAFFGLNVLIPQWLQFNMGYTATWSGRTVAWMGVFAVLCAPLVAGVTGKIDARLLTFIGVGWLGVVTLWLSFSNNDMTYWDVALPFLFIGVGLPMFMVPLNAIALSCVEDSEMEGAAGIMNFLRTLGGAFSTSLTTTAWENAIRYNRAELVGIANPAVVNAASPDASSGELMRNVFSLMIDGQSVMLATNHVLFTLSTVLFLAAATIWLAPRMQRVVDTSKVH